MYKSSQSSSNRPGVNNINVSVPLSDTVAVADAPARRRKAPGDVAWAARASLRLRRFNNVLLPAGIESSSIRFTLQIHSVKTEF